jgi:hypothetical protein
MNERVYDDNSVVCVAYVVDDLLFYYEWMMHKLVRLVRPRV